MELFLHQKLSARRRENDGVSWRLRFLPPRICSHAGIRGAYTELPVYHFGDVSHYLYRIIDINKKTKVSCPDGQPTWIVYRSGADLAFWTAREALRRRL